MYTFQQPVEGVPARLRSDEGDQREDVSSHPEDPDDEEDDARDPELELEQRGHGLDVRPLLVAGEAVAVTGDVVGLCGEERGNSGNRQWTAKQLELLLLICQIEAFKKKNFVMCVGVVNIEILTIATLRPFSSWLWFILSVAEEAVDVTLITASFEARVSGKGLEG